MFFVTYIGTARFPDHIGSVLTLCNKATNHNLWWCWPCYDNIRDVYDPHTSLATIWHHKETNN